MAIIGSIDTVRSQLSHLNRFQVAFAHVADCLASGSKANRRLLAVGEGKTERVELAGGAFALEQSYRTKPRSEGFFETHRAYIDVQVIVAGEELMEVADYSRLMVSEDLTPGKDLIKYQMFDAASIVRMKAGDAAIYYPADGHMGGLMIGGPSLVYKVVVKVPVFV